MKATIRESLLPKILLAAIASGLLLSAGTVQAQAVLEEVTVTAQKREVGLQDAPLSITAFSGAALEKGRILNAGDLAKSTAGFSFTNPTPFDMELNIRGVMNTRLDAPSASRSIGVFVDEVVVGRMGLMSMDFYDLERVEILRGPQGVLLGKNVVGGALSIITAKPQFETSGDALFSVGNLDSLMFTGHVTGALSEKWAGRAAVQFRKNSGFATDVLLGRDLHDIEAGQARVSALYQGDNDLMAHFTLEYLDEKGNGTCGIGTGGNPWDITRDFVGLDDIRECMPEPVQYSNSPIPRNQGYDRNALSFMLKIEKEFDGSTLTSVTGYRDGEGESQYSQTGLGPDAPGVTEAFFAALGGTGNPAHIGTLGLAFDFPVRESEELSQFSQELRLTSNYSDSRWDWIAGGYYQKDETDKFDRFWSEVLLNVIGAVGTLNGESTWDNRGETKSYAFFGQAGFQIIDPLKLTIGGRYTKDKVNGTVQGVAVELGDKFNPADMIPLTPLNGEPGPGGIIPYPKGGGFTTPYSDSWDQFTWQGILEWQANDGVMLYASASEGYKMGGFQDTPSNSVGASVPYEPETVLALELGIKSQMLDNRLRINAALYDMDYKDLQVEFTNDQCLCNIVSNASDASIRGMELEIQFAATESLYTWFSGSYNNTEYEDYVISTGDFSGNQMQRTPETQINLGFDLYAGAGDWGDAWMFRLNYTWQDKMPWAHTNVEWEDSYYFLDGRIQLAPRGKPWRVSLWGKNLTDEDVRANVIEFLGGTISLYTPPRTYGIDFGWVF